MDSVAYLQALYDGGYESVDAYPLLSDETAADERGDKLRFGDQERFIVTRNPVRLLGNSVRRYSPGIEPGMFLTLAEMTSAPDRIEAAASQYGFLRGDMPALVHVGQLIKGAFSDDPTVWGELRIGERIGTWQVELGKMQEAVSLWRGVQSGDSKLLFTLAGGAAAPEADVGESMLDRVRQLVNAGLADNVAARLVTDPGRGEATLTVAPKNLLGVAWLQLAQALSRKTEFRRCSECGAWFERATRGKEKVFCSSRCRIRAHRAQKGRGEN